jgi:hypothetical protein
MQADDDDDVVDYVLTISMQANHDDNERKVDAHDDQHASES